MENNYPMVPGTAPERNNYPVGYGKACQRANISGFGGPVTTIGNLANDPNKPATVFLNLPGAYPYPQTGMPMMGPPVLPGNPYGYPFYPPYYPPYGYGYPYPPFAGYYRPGYYPPFARPGTYAGRPFAGGLAPQLPIGQQPEEALAEEAPEAEEAPASNVKIEKTIVKLNKRRRGIALAIFETIFALLVFGAAAALLYFMKGLVFGYAVIGVAALLVLVANTDRSKFFRFAAWIVALGLCVSAFYIARADTSVPILDSLKVGIDAAIDFFKDFMDKYFGITL